MTVDTLNPFSYFYFSPHFEIAKRLYYIRKFQTIYQDSGAMNGYGDKQVLCPVLTQQLSFIYKQLLSMQLMETTVNSDVLVMKECLHQLSFHGIQHLLGFRHTVGSVDILYPSRDFLLECFERPNNPKSKLTVGARALSKHCIRCKAQWGE